MAAQYLLRPFWFIKSEEHTGLAMFEMIFTILVLPITLVVAVYLATKKFDKRKWFLLTVPVICSCIYVSSRLGFYNWADSVGSRQHPDNETLMVVALEWQAGLIVTILGLTICLVRLYWKRRKIAS